MFTNKNLFSNACKLVLTTVFYTQKQVVKIEENKYAARFKKWYYFNWRYIGMESTHSKYNYSFVLVASKEEACQKLKYWFLKPQVVNCC